MKMFNKWSMTKQIVFVVVLLVASFFLRYFLMCYSGIDTVNIWIRVVGSEFLFPRYVLVFGLVNLLIPGMLSLFFRVLDVEATFCERALGATSSIAVASFYWHIIYMYPGMDEGVSFFASLTIAGTIFYSYCVSRKGIKGQKFTRSMLRFPAVLMPVFRWGYSLLMNYDMVPTMDCFVGRPFYGPYAGYDVLCLIVLLICILKKMEKGPMLLIRVPGKHAQIAMEAAVLDKYLGKWDCDHLNRFILGTAVELEEEVFGWKNLVKNTFIDSDEEEEVIVAHVKEDGDHMFLICETEEELEEAKKWLEAFLDEDDLTYARYFMPKDFMFMD